MIQFNVLTGKKAGSSWVARRFPVRAGRSPSADLHLSEAGVWDEHFEVRFKPGVGFVLVACSEALSAVNGRVARETILRNGDIVTAGGMRLQFWLAETRQLGLGWREWSTWAGIAAVSLLQVALVYWLRP
jgi:pSer/pThr/pTyr-binding forkhead associated (FHA) protein